MLVSSALQDSQHTSDTDDLEEEDDDSRSTSAGAEVDLELNHDTITSLRHFMDTARVLSHAGGGPAAIRYQHDDERPSSAASAVPLRRMSSDDEAASPAAALFTVASGGSSSVDPLSRPASGASGTTPSYGQQLSTVSAPVVAGAGGGRRLASEPQLARGQGPLQRKFSLASSARGHQSHHLGQQYSTVAAPSNLGGRLQCL